MKLFSGLSTIHNHKPSFRFVCAMNRSHVCGFEPYVPMYRPQYESCEHEIACRYWYRFILKQPAVGRTPAQETLAVDVDCLGQASTGEEHAATDKVLEHIAICSGDKN